MKAIAFAQRLLRDLKEKDVASLAAADRQEIGDAINGALQKLHDLSPPHAREADGSVLLAAPLAVIVELAAGSAEFTGYTAGNEQLHCTIRIEGDPVDNRITGANSLLHPYGGATGPRTAMIYHDAALIPEPFAEIISRPRVLETRRVLEAYRVPGPAWEERGVSEPREYRVEANAVNQSSPAPAVLRVDPMPDRSYRLEMRVALAPARISFTDLLSGIRELPLREEHVEAYLLPIARGLLCHSTLWRNAEMRPAVLAAASQAEAAYAVLAPKTQATPCNRVGSPVGY